MTDELSIGYLLVTRGAAPAADPVVTLAINQRKRTTFRLAFDRPAGAILPSGTLVPDGLDENAFMRIAISAPIEAVATSETIAVPEDLVGRRDTYVLRVRGNSMIDEQICDGDFVIVEDRKTAQNGETVVALVGGSDVTLKKLYRENGRVRLQPANAAVQPIVVEADQVQVQGVVVGVMRKY